MKPRIYLYMLELRLTFLLIILSSAIVSSQPFFHFNDSVTVTKNGQTLANPWAGGLNFVQFSEIDLNLDGKLDLLAFDRSGFRINTFINQGNAGQTNYRFNPFYSYFFPKAESWMLLRDYNNDQKADIFTYRVGAGAITIWKNTSTSDTPTFDIAVPLLRSNYLPNMLNLYVNAVDIPTIDDLDYDGDLDILTFNVLGGFMEHHKNLSVDSFGTPDSLSFRLQTSCWGKMMENATGNSVHLDTCSFLDFSQIPEDPNPLFRHSGSTSFAIDADQDGLKDLVIGDLSFNTLTILYNDGTLDTAHIYSQNPAFPTSNPVNLEVFPAGFYLDLTNDGIKDLVVSPNVTSLGANIENNWFYKNNGSNDLPNLSLQSKSFLNGGMIEVGEGAYPVLVDLDQDGLTDLVIGNRGYKRTGEDYVGKIAYYRNIGNAEQPSFDLVTDDLANLGLFGYANPYPAFTDLDGDSDLDMLVGRYQGTFDYYENSAQPGNPPQFTYLAGNYQNLFVGQNSFAAPQFFDVDKDGLVDLLVGEYNGNLNYFHNNGTPTNPQFSLVSDFFGQIKTNSLYTSLGYSTPCMFRTNGVTKLFCGSEDGTIYYYDQIDGNLEGTFHTISKSYQNIDEGTRTAISLAYLNNDTLLDMVIGNYAGGVSLYFGTSDSLGIPYSTPTTPYSLAGLQIYPNPAHESIQIKSPEESPTFSYQIFDVMGKQLSQGLVKGNQEAISIQNLTPGIYFLSLSKGNACKNLKLVVN
ncbi:MAG: T9SS type A sorting domain-containing protein [Bacteroidia bacterium]|nr:T9SS type A sorting domain-containing protein [Bacteroidia bacterium]